MGHLINAKEEVYRALAERLNRNPVGAPVSETLMEILYRLYTESEAMVGSKFPLVPMTLDKIAAITGVQEEELAQILDNMASKGLVLDLPRRDTTYYMLAPVVVGFFEYTFMRVREDVDMKELAELFEKYFQSPEVKEEFFGGDTKMFRTLVYESLIPAIVETEVLSYERASEIIRQSGGGALTMCSCRHKASHLGKACEAPLYVCTSLGSAAQWVVRRGFGKPATVDELLRVLEQTEKLGLVHMCDNVLNRPAYICHCCGCCCHLLRAIKEAGKPVAAHPSNFLPVLDTERCMRCGTCAESCHIGAMTIQDPGSEQGFPALNRELCIGCGVCAAACPAGALTMTRRAVLHVPPEDKKQQMLRIAREKGRA
ncbi:4Fe-4S binding protein [Desulfovirgula thermocuniculi]|uniref:4Fe-4S binding protein n=1 Tax=Desulfovirgula thermocuniculi TaxID=348842 RepID=UPI000405F27F|nr:4Fe-4S binding protein [Desulfovirgula thermocuniculi]